LVLNPGQPDRQTIEVRGPKVLIGREDDCDVVIDDPTVSRHHATISAHGGAGLTLEDMGSANGTLVNGKPITEAVGFRPAGQPRADVHGGDWLQFGDVVAVLSRVPPPPPE
jgi:pSer/pThr/pTyr-binding forkhead associated (FHA) protein